MKQLNITFVLLEIQYAMYKKQLLASEKNTNMHIRYNEILLKTDNYLNGNSLKIGKLHSLYNY